MKHLNLHTQHNHLRTVFVLMVLGLLTLFSCTNNDSVLESNSISNDIGNLKIIEGILQIDSKASLKSIVTSYQKDVEGQNRFNDGIRNLQGKGFKPLTPLFNENQTEEIQNFVLSKKKRIQKRNGEFGISSKSASTSEGEIDLDDELIKDPVLTGLLNEDREIIVADSLYKYTETGLYFCLVVDKDKLYSYLNKLTPSTKRNKVAKISSRVAPCAEMLKTAQIMPEPEVT
jgi:hypothetical protein